MSENSKINFRELLKKTAVTYDQAAERIKSEQQRTQVDRFRIGEDGEYAVRVLPLAPYLTASGEIDETKPIRPSFEYPVKQMFIDIKGPAKKKGGKPQIISVPIVCATQEGVNKSVDLIDTYKKLVKELYPEDKDLIDKMNANSYGNKSSLRWSYQRVLYVFDLDAKKRIPLLWQVSFPQYNDFSGRQMKLWEKLKKKDEDAEDPLASFGVSYPLEIERKTEKGNTTYGFNIDSTSEDELDDADMEALFNAPRIPDIIYRYTRYQMEATIEFLKQYDEDHELDIMSEEAMTNAIDQLKGEMDANDQSHFDLTSAGEKGEGKSKITFEQLNDRYNALLDKGLADDSDEGVDLREDIRAYIEDNNLDVVMKHSTSTADVLDAIEEAEENQAKKEKKAEKEADPEPEEKETKRRPRREETDDDKDKAEKKEDKPSDDDERASRRSRRAARPTDDDEDDKDKAEKEDKPADEPEPRGERRRRRHSADEE